MTNDLHEPGEESTDNQLEAIIGSLDADDLSPSSPPTSVWNRIAAELVGERPAFPPPVLTDQSKPASRPTGVATRPARPARRWIWAAAAAVIVIVAGTAAWLGSRPDDRVVATAQLAYEPDFDQAGANAAASATLIEKNGQYLISLSDSKLPSELGADLELWLIADNDGTLDVQPVSIIDQGDGTYSVPAGLDPDTHNIVDISIEPRDGDATHSGRSILRGVFVAA